MPSLCNDLFTVLVKQGACQFCTQSAFYIYSFDNIVLAENRLPLNCTPGLVIRQLLRTKKGQTVNGHQYPVHGDLLILLIPGLCALPAGDDFMAPPIEASDSTG